MTEIFNPNRKTFEEILKEFDVTIDINKGNINPPEKSNGDDKTQESGSPDDGDTLG